jgi:cellulose synthase/poly-beta-1,6-N-acetylglucosamine synthase-like glycosyltransferase
VRQAGGDVLVFSDANTMVEPGAIRALACNFADPSVGGVVGCTGYQLESGTESSSRGEDMYWRYDTWLKELESRTGSVVSAHGGLYAIRSELYREPQDTAVTDDFIISTAVVEQGRRLVFERSARAWEVAVPTSEREFGRRVRLMTRGLRGVALRRRLLNPFNYGFYALILLTHKVLRRLTPVALLLLFVASVMLSGTHPLYGALAGAQALFYVTALAGYFMRSTGAGQSRVLFVPFFYCMANLAALFALFRFARGERIVSWQPQRHASPT